MALTDRLSELVHKIAPPKSKQSTTLAGGIGNGHGMASFDDNMIVSKPVIVAHASQIFFNFLAMACFASVAAFQAKWDVGPSGLSGFALFVAISGMFLSAFMLLVPVAYEKYDKFVQLARTLKEVRVSFILTGTGITFSLLIAFITTISSWTQPGCKNAENDPHAEEKGDEFKKGLSGWCSTKKAGSIFFWFAFIAWAVSLALLILDWRNGRLNAHTHRDPPFTRPHAQEEGEEDEEASYHHVSPVRTDAPSNPYQPSSHSYQPQSPTRYDAEGSSPYTSSNPFADSNRYNGGAASALPPHTTAYTSPAAGRPSMDAYGAFSDPAPSGFGASQSAYAASPGGAAPAPILPEPDLGPRVSRTMQYADPYAAVRASVAGASSPTRTTAPPGYGDGGYGYR